MGLLHSITEHFLQDIIGTGYPTPAPFGAEWEHKCLFLCNPIMSWIFFGHTQLKKESPTEAAFKKALKKAN